MAIPSYVQAFRRLFRQPVFSLLTIWTVAIGIGASAAVFAPLDALLLRPLPFERSERLVRLFATNPAQGVERAGLAWGDFLDLRRASRSLESVASYRTLTATRTGGERPEVVQVALVTAGLFDVLREHPALGGGFAPAHEQPGREAVVVLSHAYWQSRFDGSPQVVGRGLELEGQPHTILGVMPEGFAFPDPEVQMWAPLALPSEAPDRLSHYLATVGRLASNGDLATARRELAGLAERLERQHPESNEGWAIEAVPFQESLVARFRPALRVLAIAVGLLMLITCVNVSSLLLARAAERRAESALRTALGSSRPALVGDHLLESVMLAVIGGGVGLLLGGWFVSLVLRQHRTFVPLIGEIGLDLRVLAFAAALALVTGVVSGLLPALQLAHTDLHNTLIEHGGTVSEGRRARRWRASLVVVETALAILLLIGAGLMLRSFVNLQSVDLGFRPETAVALDLSLPGTRYPGDAALVRFAGEVRERLESAPDVAVAAVGSAIPLHTRGQNVLPFRIAGVDERQTEGRYIPFAAVGPGYFEALGLPLLAGRAIDRRDHAEAPAAAVVTAAAAEQLFPGGEAVGGTIFLTPRGTEAVPYRVVGVVGDHLQRALTEAPQPAVFVPFSQVPHASLFLVVRYQGEAEAAVDLARRAILAVDPDQPVARVLPLSEVIEAAGARTTLYTRLFLVFGALGLLLASSGIYGVIAYQTAKRQRELGIRMALGAERRRLLAGMVRESVGYALLGALFGIAIAYLLSRFLSSLLFGIEPHDPAVFVAVPLLMLLVAALGTLLGARKVLTVRPDAVLRSS